MHFCRLGENCLSNAQNLSNMDLLDLSGSILRCIYATNKIFFSSQTKEGAVSVDFYQQRILFVHNLQGNS